MWISPSSDQQKLGVVHFWKDGRLESTITVTLSSFYIKLWIHVVYNHGNNPGVVHDFLSDMVLLYFFSFSSCSFFLYHFIFVYWHSFCGNLALDLYCSILLQRNCYPYHLKYTDNKCVQ